MKYLLLISILLCSNVWACRQNTLKLSSIDPMTGEKFELEVKSYIGKKAYSKQVIILPPIGGVSTLEERYAKKICKRGGAAFVFYHWTDDMEASVEDLSVHARGTHRGLFAVETFLEYSDKPTRILGTSLGGVYAGIAAGKFDQIEKVVIIASGTNLSHIMSTSSLPELVALKKKRFDLFGFQSNQDYAYAIKKNLNIEASDFKNNFAGKKLLFFKTLGDSVILPEYQQELIDLFDQENSLVYKSKYGHKKGIIMTFLRRAKRISNFLTY